MVFWRKKKNLKEQEQEEKDDHLLHPRTEPDMEPSIDEADSDLNEDQKHEFFEKTENDIIEEAETSPVPQHTKNGDIKEAEELKDHSNEGGWFSKLTKGLSKSSNKISKGIGDIFTKKKLDDETLQELEDLLITADLGPKTASELVQALRAEKFDKEVDIDEVKEFLADEITKILEPVAKIMPKAEHKPHVVLVAGVNGVGKTTTIGKFAKKLSKEGKSVMLGAGDTFRAAAVEQLQVWAQRTGADFVSKDIGSDAAALAYEAYEQAKAKGTDVLMVDTAGRLQNKKNLMEELAKIVRVLKKQDERAPHEVLLVLDATTGQNAVSQVETFKELVNITGLIVTKLDGSAKGGILVSLANQFGLPVYAIGMGEGIDDLQPFSAPDYAKSLIGLA